MGHSVTSYKEAGFVAKDWKVQAWLFLLVRKVDAINQPDEWLLKARSYWHEQATIAVNGCIDPRLDEFLKTDDQVQFTKLLVQEIYNDFNKMGEFVSKDFLNGLHGPVPPLHSYYSQDVETEHFLKYGRAFLKLLSGKMTASEFA